MVDCPYGCQSTSSRLNSATTADAHLRRYWPIQDLGSVEGVERRLFVYTDVDRDFSSVVEVLDREFNPPATVEFLRHLVEDLIPSRQDTSSANRAANLVRSGLVRLRQVNTQCREAVATGPDIGSG